jgi:hypothetical protein
MRNALAIHTIEMIPKSMILKFQNDFNGLFIALYALNESGYILVAIMQKHINERKGKVIYLNICTLFNA